MRTAILFRCHNQDIITIHHLNKLAATGLPVFIIYDSTNKPDFVNAFNITNQDLINNIYQNATAEQLAKLPQKAIPIASPNIYFNIEQTILMWYFSKPENMKYDYIWSIEYDVNFHGNWQHFFHTMYDDESDFLGTDIIHFPDYHFYDGYWDTYRTPVNDSNKITSFGCIQRYSRELLQFAHIDCQNGFHGFYEQVMPTIASIHNLQIKDINRVAIEKSNKEIYHPFTCSGIANNYIIKNSEKLKNYENYLFHPVKEFM